MVRVVENNLIIELECPNGTAAETLHDLQNGIIEAIQYWNYKDFGAPEYQYKLLELLRETLPTYEQQKAILKQKTK